VKALSLLIAIIPVLAGQTGMVPANSAAHEAGAAANGALKGAAVPAKAAAQGAVYIVSRATTAESRALLSARLLKMNATKLHWYEDAGVVRAQISPKALATLRADRDVVLVLSETVPAETTPGGQAAVAQEASVQPALPLSPEPAPTAGVGPPAPASSPASLQTAASSQTGTSAQQGCGGPVLPQSPGAFPPAGALPPMPMAGMSMAPMGVPQGGGIGFAMPGVGLVDSLAGGVAQHLLNRPPSCKVSISRTAEKFGAAGGEGLIEVNASGSCAWQAQSSVPWIKILSGSGVSGSGVVSYSVDPAGGKNRSGAIWIATSPSGSPIKGKASQVVTQTK
jgi:hypothetical protein